MATSRASNSSPDALQGSDISVPVMFPLDEIDFSRVVSFLSRYCFFD